MRWFVTQENCISPTEYRLSAEDSHYLSRVRRLKQGEKIDLVVEGSVLRSCEVVSIEKDTLTVSVLEELPVRSPVTADITLIQGLPKQDKFSEILNTCTQVGVSTFYPVEMSRCIVSYSEKQKMKKRERWLDVAKSASLQSFQMRQSEIKEVASWTTFLSNFNSDDYDLLIVGWEDEVSTTLKESLKRLNMKNPKIALVIGPEGGMTQNEVDALKRKGFVSVTFGGTILRTEVAGLVGCSQIMYHFS